MDGGSSLNIMYYDTFKRMGLPETLIHPSKTTFHGIVPGRKAYSLGRLVLDVAFGSEQNFRREKVCFELVNFKSPYHCILRRPAFAKFMA
jgi:trimethylamine:corrinoid methyltransferase-like protein